MSITRQLVPVAVVITLGAGLACSKPEAEIKKEIADAYAAGQQAFKDGKARETNPYLTQKKMEHAAKAWYEGWDAAKVAKDEADRKAAEEEARRKAEEEAKAKAAALLAAQDEARRKAEAEAAAKLAAFKAAAEAALKDINFDYDKSFIREVDKTKLQAIADFLKANAQVKLQIEGHCDERGTEQYNMALGERRANAAQKYLVGLGIADTRLSTISYGKEKPKQEGHNEESWLINRRCEFKMTQQ